MSATIREQLAEQAGQIRYENAPRMVQLRHKRHEGGYSVIAESDADVRGLEVGHCLFLHAAKERAETLRTNPDAWMHGKVGAMAIYNVSDLRIVERYESEAQR